MLHFFAGRRKTDRQDSPEDQDLTRYGVRFFSRPWHRTTISAKVVRDKDDGGTIPTKNTRATLRVKWAYRQLAFTLNASHNLNSFGDTDTERNRIEAILSREF
jgi:hypothetical protein